MEVAGLVLGVIPELRKQVRSIKERISKYRENPGKYSNLIVHLSDLTKRIDQLDKLAIPDALPVGTADLFNEDMAKAREFLIAANEALQVQCTEAFAGSSSGSRARKRDKLYKFFRTDKLHGNMASVEVNVKNASGLLEDIFGRLTPLLSNKEQTKAIFDQNKKRDNAILEAINKKDKQQNQSTEEVYLFRPSTPEFTHVVDLNFDTEGELVTPEANLKRSVLSSISSDTITAAAGVQKDAFGVVGMAGVGKSVALQSLAFDEDIKKQFSDGVHYLSFGQDATDGKAVREIVKIMRRTGASARDRLEKVGRCTKLKDAVDLAVEWFEGKACLYLVDDLWPAKDCTYGYLIVLRQLLRGSPRSRMAITTRSTIIADRAGLVVSFGARATLGSVSKSMFLTYAWGSASLADASGRAGELRPSVAKILTACEGLPIALAVAGCSVATLASACESFDSACDAYAFELEKNISSLGDEPCPEGKTLRAGILLSLGYLQVEFLKVLSTSASDYEHNITDLYESLGVLTKQAWIPVSVLSRMWKLDENVSLEVAKLFSGMSLATIQHPADTDRFVRDTRLRLHDLHLDFCQHARLKKPVSFWHGQLVRGHLPETPNRLERSISLAPGTSLEQELLSCSPRPWWTIADAADGYIHANLARHMSSSNFGVELGALLLDARWTQMRFETGGILALKTDFECFADFLVSHESATEGGAESDIKQSFELILKALYLSWGRVSDGPRGFLFQMCGRMCSWRKINVFADAYLQSFETHTPKPYLLPKSLFFPEPRNGPEMEIFVGGPCYAVASSPCGLYVAAGARIDIVIANALTGEILQRLKGHTDDVMSITFGSGSKTIISGCKKGTIIFWEWETSSARVQHVGDSNNLRHYVLISNRGQLFLASVNGFLRSWDATTGTTTCKRFWKGQIDSLAVSVDDRTVAFGTTRGWGTVEEHLTIFDTSTERIVYDKPTEAMVTSVAFSPDGKWLAAGSGTGSICLWDTQTWTTVCSLEEHESLVYCLTFSPNGQRLASSSEDGTIRIWDIERGTSVLLSNERNSGIESIEYTYDGKRIISGKIGFPRNTIVAFENLGSFQIWDSQPHTELVEEARWHTGRVCDVELSQVGDKVVSGSEDGTVRLWDSGTGEEKGVLEVSPSEPVISVSISPDGQRIVCGAEDGLSLWDTKTLSRIPVRLDGHNGFVFPVSFSCDGFRIISGSKYLPQILIWNARTGEQIGDGINGFSKYWYCVSESSDGRQLLARFDYSYITWIWDRESRNIVWKSDHGETDADDDTSYKITDEEAKKSIRSCGQNTSRLWPDSFEQYSAEVYIVENIAYTNALGGRTLGSFPSPVVRWSYDSESKVFAAGLTSGAVAICEFIGQS